MTTPGGGGNDINLAALWIPVMPETSHMGEEMRRAGQTAKRQFEQGFNSGSSPESMGQNYGQKLASSMQRAFQGFELPFGMSKSLDKFSQDVDEKLVRKLRGEATQALQTYRTEWDNLSSAQSRATDAEQKLNLARDNGIKSAQVVIPLMREHEAAQKNLTEAHTKASVALDDYRTKNTALGEELEKTAGSGRIMAGIMGGAIVLGAQMAVHAVESFVETVARGFEKSIELTAELADKAVELGETYEHIGIQIHEFSTASGEGFDSMNAAAQHVFSTLDVAGKDVGKTMAQLSSILGVPGAQIQTLTRDVTELQGRYTSLKAVDLGASFNAFKVPAQEADAALASLLQSARGSGQDLGQLASALSGNVALTLHEAGLNIQQAGKFTAEMMAMGEPGRQAMTGMATAMKDFKTEGLSFADGMKEAGTQLQALGDTVAGQDLAETLFGTRNWIVAKDAVASYIDIVNQGPAAFNASSDSIRQFTDDTADLGNKIEAFKHQAEDAFKPFGEAAKKAAETGLKSISDWFSLHRTQIIADIKHWGVELIDFLPVAKQWTVDALDIFALFAEGMGVILSPVITGLGLAGAGMLALTGHFSEAGQLLKATGEFDWDVFSGKLALNIEGIKAKLQSMHLDTTGIKDDFIAAADAANQIPTTVGMGAGLSGLVTPPGTPGSPGSPGSPPSSGGPAGQWWLPDTGGPAAGPHAGAPPSPSAGAGGRHNADWDAIAQNESGGRWTVPTPGPVPYGGGLQIKPDTWYEFGGLAYSEYPYQTSKENQIVIAERILNGWGTRPGQGPNAWANGATYVEKKQAGGYVGIGGGQGDDVHALLKRGEYVWDTETTDKWGWLIKALHQGFSQGGEVGENPYTGSSGVLQVIYSNTATGQKTGEAGGLPVGPGTTQPGYYGKDWEGHQGHVHTSFATSPSGEFYGLPKGTDIRQGQSGFPAWVYAMGQAFGLEASTYAGHQESSGYNRGIDWWPKGHADMSGGSYSTEEKQRLQAFATSVASYGQERGGSAGSPSAWGMSAPLAFGGPRGGDNPQFPGMPYQYSGQGVYGGETEDQRRQLDKAVQEANDRKADLDRQVIVNQRAVDDLKDQIAHVGDPTKVGALGHPVALTPAELAAADVKRKKLNEELDNATYNLTKSQREAGEQIDNVNDALRKQQEGALKPPGKTTEAQPHAVGEAAFQALGASFLSGIGQELGFGDLFSKPPWEWGAVKLLTGVAGWAMGTANAWSDAIISGKTDAAGPFQGAQGGGGGASSLLSGLTSSLGLPLPKASVSAGPNIVPVQPLTTQHGTGQGQPPGPVVQGDYMPINVQAGVDPNVVTPIMTEQRNSQAAQAAGQTGGLPAP